MMSLKNKLCNNTWQSKMAILYCNFLLWYFAQIDIFDKLVPLISFLKMETITQSENNKIFSTGKPTKL